MALGISIKFVLGALLLQQISLNCSAITPDSDQNDPTAAIKILKGHIQNLTNEEFIKEDYFLENWLRLRNFDVQTTFDALQEFIEWRAKENISSILHEDWFDMREKFPYSLDSVDIEGRPVHYIDPSSWEVCKYLAESDSASYDRLTRYVIMFMEHAQVKLNEIRATGKNVTQRIMLGNMAGFSASKAACLKCLQVCRHTSDIHTKFYAHSLSKAVLVNVPYIFRMVYFFLSAETRTYLQMYGQDRGQWEAEILGMVERKFIPPGLLDELPERDNFEGHIIWDKEL